jgi:hypothetical protein
MFVLAVSVNPLSSLQQLPFIGWQILSFNGTHLGKDRLMCRLLNQQVKKPWSEALCGERRLSSSHTRGTRHHLHNKRRHFSTAPTLAASNGSEEAEMWSRARDSCWKMEPD